MLSAPGGMLRLPLGAVCVEDSVTAPGNRGRGVAPGALRTLAAELQRQGATSLLTKIDETNTPSRRAAAKIGFKEIGTMHFRRVGPWRRTTMTDGTGEAGTWLQSTLR
jgi:L-amino acid N-acyltransferase YncA